MTKYASLLKQVDELAARVDQKQLKWLQIIVNDGEDQQPAMERALAEWQAAHPRAKKRTVDDFDWIIRLVAKSWAVSPDVRLSGPPSSGNYDGFSEEEEARRKGFARRLHYPESGWV
jgi:hypothetical protein